jgi:simple sugar transport system permease protein
MTQRNSATGSSSQALAKLIWPVIALLALLLMNAFFNRAFFSFAIVDGHLSGTLVNVLERAAPIILCALGMTLVIGTGGVDLSVGAIMAMAGAMAAYLVSQQGLHPSLALAAALVVSLFAGAWNGLLVSLFRVQPIVATLILMVAGRGIAQLITDGQIITVSDPTMLYIGGGYLMGLPIAVSVAAIAYVLTVVLTRHTALGLFIESIGDNETASRYAGLNVRLIKLLVYMFCGLCAGVAGVLYMADNTGADANNAGLYMELDAILSVVIGGTALTGGRFYLVGSIIGGLIIQTLTTTILMIKLFGQSIQPDYNLVVKAIVVLAVCLLQSETFRGMVFSRRRWRTAR